MGKISDQSSLGTRQATAEVELIYGGQNYRQSVSVLFTGFYPADNDATLAANSSSLVPTQAAVKSYVDSSIYGLKWKQSVRAATTAALTLATDFENGDIIDGYTLQTGDRILIKNQVSAIDNGIYVVAASGAPTRAADADSGAELVSASVMVERGTVNADTQWTCTANTITVGVSNITWAQITSSGVADGDYGDIVVSSGVWSLDSSINFSGKTLSNGTLSGVAISGASSIATTVAINANTSAFTLHDNSDTTKTATFVVSGITTGTNRQFTYPNASGTIALTSDITAGTVTATGGSLTSNAVVLGAGTTDTKVVAGITTDGTSKLNLGVAGSSVGAVVLANATSGSITIQPPTGALGTVTVTVPAATDTLVGKATTDTLTNKTLTSPKVGTAILDTNGNELFNVTATASAVNELTYANAATGGVPTFTASGGDTNVSIDLVPKGTHITDSTVRYNGTEIGFRAIPQNSQSAAYTTVASDRGKHILHPAADTNARTFTIDSNANVAYPIGTAITFVNETSQVVTIAITSDTLTLAGTTTTGSRSLAQNGVATALKITSTKWIVSGTGLT